jgi:hypothetical protein
MFSKIIFVYLALASFMTFAFAQSQRDCIKRAKQELRDETKLCRDRSTYTTKAQRKNCIYNERSIYHSEKSDCFEQYTPAPTPAPTPSNTTRLLQVDPEEPCSRVLQASIDQEYCRNYENLPLDSPKSCDAGKKSKVPKIYHAVSSTSKPPFIVQSNALANPEYRFNYQNDKSAETYIRENCGEHVAEAYNCFAPAAYRADIFRFCALHAEGGLYMDADMVPVGPFETLYSNCSGFSMGYDFPQGELMGKQMKILASEPKHEIALCMLESIVENIRNRYIGETSLGLTGPTLLHKCYQKFLASSDEKVAITYLDTRMAMWPYTGMRTTEEILAYEAPRPERHFKSLRSEYADLYENGEIYKKECTLF